MKIKFRLMLFWKLLEQWKYIIYLSDKLYPTTVLGFYELPPCIKSLLQKVLNM